MKELLRLHFRECRKSYTMKWYRISFIYFSFQNFFLYIKFCKWHPSKNKTKKEKSAKKSNFLKKIIKSKIF